MFLAYYKLLMPFLALYTNASSLKEFFVVLGRLVPFRRAAPFLPLALFCS